VSERQSAPVTLEGRYITLAPLLGAVREGTLRKHMNVRGYQRDTVYFSILDTEWPAISARLAARLYA
jgi:hypothetical protein